MSDYGNIVGQTLDVCGGLSLYNNYMNQYQNMGNWYQKLADEKAKKWNFDSEIWFENHTKKQKLKLFFQINGERYAAFICPGALSKQSQLSNWWWDRNR